MKRINLTDNNCGKGEKCTFFRKDISGLFKIADKSIRALCLENEDLLIFPHSIDSCDDKIGDSSFIISIRNTTDLDKATIVTGNTMGFVGVENCQLTIKSRFDEGHNNYFLHYMLQRVFSLNFFDLRHGSDNDEVFNLLLSMFPYFLRTAMHQGIYKVYRKFERNDSRVKGTIDTARHIARNTPFIGKVAYTTNEHSLDNDMTELIRHTIEFMRTSSLGQSVLNVNRETKEQVRDIIKYTPSYDRNKRSEIISKNLRSKRHPYFTAYQPLQSLCLQILRKDEIEYGENNQNIYGILFDGAWLWEEYLNTLLEDMGFHHPQNKKNKDAIYLFEGNQGKRYPDFYKGNMVFDAKYKRLEVYDKLSRVGRDDLHQLITYVAIQKASVGGFIVPLTKKQSNIPHAILKNSHSTMLYILGIKIDNHATSYTDFCRQMEESEQQFVKDLNALQNTTHYS